MEPLQSPQASVADSTLLPASPRVSRRSVKSTALTSSSHLNAQAAPGVGVRRRADLDRDLHCEMVRRGAEPRTSQRDRLARLAHDRYAHEVLIPDHAARRVEVDPAGAWNVDLHPSMCVAAGDIGVVVIVKMQISGNEP